MSCVVGVTDGKNVTLGGDSASVNGNTLMTNTFPKVFKLGSLKVGFAGSWRVGQLLQSSDIRSSAGVRASDYFMVKDFVPALRDLLAKNGAITRENGKDSYDGVIMVGREGRLFTVWQEFQVEESQFGYEAIGCARDIALGSLYTTALSGHSPHSRVKIALDAACALSTDVTGPTILL